MLSADVSRVLAGLRRRPKAELHLHLEGAVSPGTLVSLSGRGPHRLFPDAGAVVRRRRRLGSPEAFLGFYRDVCRLLRDPADYAFLARDLVRRLSRDGTRHAEVYVSPAIVERIGLPWRSVVATLEPVFGAWERRSGGRLLVLLDSVRHWGPAVAHRVLDLHESTPWGRVAGFGLGGDETSIPAAAFRDVYARVRALGLAPLVHAGEWGGPDSVADALEHLRPVRIAHGIRAVDDPALLRRLVRRGIALDVCLRSNAATGALRPGEVHPVRRLIAAGVTVTLSTDDPGLFGTSLLAEYRGLARLGASGRDLRAVAASSLSAALHRPASTLS